MNYAAFRFVLVLMLAVFLAGPLPGGQSRPSPTVYQGFTIDDSKVQNLPTLEEIRAAMREQIDMVCAVGLSADTLKFFQSVPFVLMPAEAIRSPTPGLYDGRTVKVSSRIAAVGHKPVLLHELLHAYHHHKLAGGTKNRPNLGLYEAAKAGGHYAASSHMMRNPGEFFACSATTYLFGVTAQEPFKRDKIKNSQPELFAFLQTLFGSEAGSHAGSLQRATALRTN